MRNELSTLRRSAAYPLDRVPKHAPFRQASPRFQVLLAMDCSRMTDQLVNSAVASCLRLGDRLDLLLINSTRSAEQLDCQLTLRLQHAGIDIRVTRREGDFVEQLLEHLDCCQGTTLIVVDQLTTLEEDLGTAMDDLLAKGCRFLPMTNSSAN